MIARPPTTAAAARYLADGAGTVSRERLLVMLYERLQRDLEAATNALRSGQREAAHVALMHAQEIVTELDLALDHDVWDGAAGLSEVYRHLLQQLIAANVGQNVVAVQDCLRIVNELLSMWTDALASITADSTSSVPIARFGDGAASADVHPTSTPTLDVVG